MKAPNITKSDVGEFVIDDKGKIHQIISYTNRPTFEIESIETKEKSSFVVGCLNSEYLTKLVREEK